MGFRKRKLSRPAALLCCLIVSVICYISIYKDASTKLTKIRSNEVSNCAIDTNLTGSNLHEKDVLLDLKKCRNENEKFRQRHEQYTRLTHLCEVCRQLRNKEVNLSDSLSPTIREQSTTLRYAQLNTNYCKVPKIGCTFMTQIFMVILNNSTDASSIFNLIRRVVHHKSLGFLKHDTPAFYTAPTILMARNPYSRLFSAYVDKIVLPAWCDSSVQIRKKIYGDDLCRGIPTFKQFLEFILESVRAQKYVDKHWAPIYTLCKPCLTRNSMIIKQETFSKDVDVLLNYLDVPNKARGIIEKAMTENRVNSSIPGIIQTVIELSKRQLSPLKHCYTPNITVKLLWKSLQVQGYIRRNNTFRIDEKYEKRLSTDNIIAILMTEIENDNITSSERKEQRWNYLVEAFQDVPNQVIDEIKVVYEADFLLFDYDSKPPS